TQVSRQAQTSNVGIYYFGALPRGPYRVEVEKTGFKKWEGTLVLEVGQDAVVDAMLQVGSVQNVVQVTGAAPVISTQSAEVADVKDYSRIRGLPLNGRQISQLFFLTPGVEGDAGNSGQDDNRLSASPRVNGMKVGSLEITMDGVSEVDRFGGGF